MDRKPHVDTLILIPTLKIYVFWYSGQMDRRRHKSGWASLTTFLKVKTGNHSVIASVCILTNDITYLSLRSFLAVSVMCMYLLLHTHTHSFLFSCPCGYSCLYMSILRIYLSIQQIRVQTHMHTQRSLSLQYRRVHFCMCMNFHLHTNKQKSVSMKKIYNDLFQSLQIVFIYDEKMHCKDGKSLYMHMEEHIHMHIRCLQGRA